MKPIPRFWRALEETAGEAAWAEWKLRLGDDLPMALPMLCAADRFVESLPDVRDPYRWSRVVQNGSEDFVGIPEDGGPSIALRREDVLVYRIDHRKLAPRPRVVRAVRLVQLGPTRPEPAAVGHPWKRAEVALVETLATIGTGVIETIKVHDGLPVALEIRQQV